MNRRVGTITLALLLGGTGSSARAEGSWCAFYDFSTYNCGFYSYEQCYATAFGNGASCRPNFFRGYGVDRPIQNGGPPPASKRKRSVNY